MRRGPAPATVMVTVSLVGIVAVASCGAPGVQTAGSDPAPPLSLATPVIVKYRDSRTDTRTELEAWIR